MDGLIEALKAAGVPSEIVVRDFGERFPTTSVYANLRQLIAADRDAVLRVLLMERLAAISAREDRDHAIYDLCDAMDGWLNCRDERGDFDTLLDLLAPSVPRV